MKRIIACLIISTLLSSCGMWNPKTGLINHYYSSSPITSSLSYDEAWSTAIDCFAQLAIPIDVLDKESGIITSKSISFRNSCTYERKGVRDNYNAYVAVPYNNSLTYIEDVTGRIYVRIRKGYSGTEITVFLQNLSARMRIDDYLWT